MCGGGTARAGLWHAALAWRTGAAMQHKPFRPIMFFFCFFRLTGWGHHVVACPALSPLGTATPPKHITLSLPSLLPLPLPLFTRQTRPGARVCNGGRCACEGGLRAQPCGMLRLLEGQAPPCNTNHFDLSRYPSASSGSRIGGAPSCRMPCVLWAPQHHSRISHCCCPCYRPCRRHC